MKAIQIRNLLMGFFIVSCLIIFSNGVALSAEKTLVFADSMVASDLFPVAGAFSDCNRVFNYSEPLVNLDPDGNWIPVLAEKYELVDGGKKWRFHIRKGVKFHNGENLTTEDVAFTIDFVKDPKNKSSRRSIVKNAMYDIIDQHTIDIYEQGKVLANPLLPAMWFAINILPKDTLTKKGAEYLSLNPIGTGPFEFVEWNRGSHLVLKAFEGYWGGRAKIDKLIIKEVPEATTRIAGLKSGDLDVISKIPPHEIKSLEKDPKLVVKRKSSLCPTFMHMRCDIPPFKDNLNLRKAVVHAIDLRTICKTILGGFATPLGSVTPPLAFGYNENITPVYKFDPSLAKEYLTKSGYKGEKIELMTTSGKYFMDLEISTAVTEYLKNIGLNVKMVIIDAPTWWDKYSHQTIAPIFMTQFCDLYADGIKNIYDTGSVNSQYGWWAKPGIPELEEQIVIGLTSHDKNKRRVAIEKASQILHEQCYYTAAWVNDSIWVMRKGIKWSPRASEFIMVTNKADKE